MNLGKCLACLMMILTTQAWAADKLPAAEHHSHHSHFGMQLDSDGAVMNANSKQLPHGCDRISAEQDFTVHVGQKHAQDPGMVFGMSMQEVHVKPCSRITITLVNDDAIRHQWMVHGLPKYLYPTGMFHLEASGGTERTGTFIVPPEPRNYLVHCDIAQHMEKGMRAQLVVGAGSGNLWAVNGVSDPFIRSSYFPQTPWLWFISLIVLLACAFVARRLTIR